jgi:hypothetical protein
MKRFVEIEYHDYMDLRPETEVRVFEGSDEESLEKNVNCFVAHMKEHWCSGTTRLMGIMEEYDAIMWVKQQIAKERANWQDDSQEIIDKICNLFKECYGKDAEELLHQLDIADDYSDREY